MRYPPDQKAKTRRLIVESAARVLRRDGIASTAVVPLMRELRLTQGAFYKNFASRDDLLIAALTHAADEVRGYMGGWAMAARADGGDPVVRIVDEYLSERHLDHPERGCLVAALGPELSRQSDDVRHHADHLCQRMFDALASHMPVDRHDRARSLYLLMAATVVSARLASGRDRQIRILTEGRAAASRFACSAAGD